MYINLVIGNLTLFLVYSRILADVIVYIFPHQHTTLRIESIMQDTTLLEKILLVNTINKDSPIGLHTSGYYLWC